MTKKKKFGSFDPSFMGITLFFDNEDEWRDYRKIEEMTHQTILSEYKLAFPESTEEEISSHDLTLWSIWGNRLKHCNEKEDLISFAGTELMKAFGSDFLYALNTSTTFAHECRHFHDWLLCPACFKDFSVRVLNCVNTFTMLTQLLQESPVIVPIPITRWTSFSDKEKENQLKIAQNLQQTDNKTIFSSIVDDSSFASIIKMIGEQKHDLSLFTHSVSQQKLLSSGVIQVNDILRWLFEESAFCVQQQAVHDSYGPTAQMAFCVGMQEVSNNRFVITTLLDRYKKHNEIIENETALRLLTWCFLGSCDEDPVARVVSLQKHLENHGIPSASLSTKNVFKALDEEIGMIPYKENLKNSISEGKRILKELSNIVHKQYSGNNEILNNLYEIYRYSYFHHKNLAKQVIINPDLYASPTKYNDRGVFTLVSPVVRLVFGSKFMFPKDEAVKGHDLQFFLDSVGKPTNYVQQCTYKSENNPMFWDVNCSNTWARYSAWTDLLFGTGLRYKIDLETAKMELKKSGVDVFEIF